jgi:hypothetical protein
MTKSAAPKEKKTEKKTEEEGEKSLQCVTTKSFLAISISARFSARFGHQHDPNAVINA